MRTAMMLAVVLAATGCAGRYGEVHAPPVSVVFTAEHGTLHYYLISPEENQPFDGGAMLPVFKRETPAFGEMLVLKSRYETGQSRLRLMPRRVVAVVDCGQYYKRLRFDLRVNKQILLDCSIGAEQWNSLSAP